MFRLTIDSTLIAKGVTAAEAYYLVGEVLGAVRHPHPLRGRRSTRRWGYEIAAGQKAQRESERPSKPQADVPFAQ
jgi:hypothetical protein